MGNGWYFWGKTSKKRMIINGVENQRSPPSSPGCLSSMFKLLSFSSAKPHYFIRHEPITTKALQAPTSSPVKEEPVEAKDNLPMPIGIRIKTSSGSPVSKIQADKSSNDSSLNICSSPNTPNLVARLMGVDHVPEYFSPSLSSLNSRNLSKSHQKELIYRKIHSINGRYSFDNEIYSCRSLPVSPRVSASRRSDVDQPRLSVQSCKESVSVFNDLESLERNMKKKKENGRDSLERKFGDDISNNLTKNKEQRKDHVLLAKPKKPLQNKNKENLVAKSSFEVVKDYGTINRKVERTESQRPSRSSKRPPKPTEVLRNKKEETLVKKNKENRMKKPKKEPIPSEILNLSATPIFPVKKEPLSPTKIPSKQKLSKESDAHTSKRSRNLAISLGQPYNPPITCHGKSKGVTQAQFHYIIEVLKFLDIDENTPVSLAKIHKPSHPLHPSVFNCLELTFSGSKDSKMCHRSNRKLTFELVDEILVDILKPYLNLKPWIYSNARCEFRRDGSLLIDQLFAKIQNFQAADCNVLEDIDQLIDRDFHKSNSWLPMAFEEENETVAEEIENYITNSLLYEIVADVLLLGVAI